MEVTGVTRRLDDLGRVTIPKELRRNLNIYEGCELMITPTENGILISKFSNNLKDDLKAVIDKYDMSCTETAAIADLKVIANSL